MMHLVVDVRLDLTDFNKSWILSLSIRFFVFCFLTVLLTSFPVAFPLALYHRDQLKIIHICFVSHFTIPCMCYLSLLSLPIAHLRPKLSYEAYLDLSHYISSLYLSILYIIPLLEKSPYIIAIICNHSFSFRLWAPWGQGTLFSLCIFKVHGL